MAWRQQSGYSGWGAAQQQQQQQPQQPQQWPAAGENSSWGQQQPAQQAPRPTAATPSSNAYLTRQNKAAAAASAGNAAGGIRPAASAAGGLRPATAAGSAAAPGPETYIVYSKTEDADEVVVRTLIGEYVESGTNHGRKFYKKSPALGQEAVDVFVYYWDGRDGPAFEGWWFGNQLGGTQVWSHCAGNGMTPPPTGWKIPWDGAVRPSLVVKRKAATAGAAAAAPVVTPPVLAASAAFASNPSGAVAATAAEAAKTALEEAKAMHENYTSLEGIQMAEDLLTPHIQVLGDAMKKAMEGQRAAAGNPASVRQFTQMGAMIRSTQGLVNTELTKLRASKQKADIARMHKAVEEKDATALADVLSEATTKTNAAEDAVEKAAITSEMIEAGGDDLDEVRQAVAQTEQAAQEAQKAIGEARIFLNAKQASCRRFECESVKQQAIAELGKLQQQLQAAQNKLNPLKTVRQELVQRTAAAKLVQETLEKLSPAEVDVDRAEEATLLMSDNPSKELMAQAEAAVAKATEHLSAVSRFISQKKVSAPEGMPREELEKFEERAKAASERLQQLKTQQREASEKVTCESLLSEAGEKLQQVAESITKTADAEAPFLMGVEELPLDETLAAVKGCEAAATAANTTISIARMFLATKLVEAKRFSPASGKYAQEKIKAFQAELETHIKKLSELKKNTAARKKSATMQEAEAEVARAEELARSMGETVAPLSDDQKFFAMSAADVRSATEQASRTEREAKQALETARKFITARQIEAKGKEMSTEVSQELIKYQARLSAAQAEVGRFKKVCVGVDARLATKKIIEEVRSRITSVEEKVKKVEEACEAFESGMEANDAEANKKATKVAESAAAEAQVTIKTATRHLENQRRLEGVSKDEVDKMHQRLKEAQEKLDETVAAMKRRAEKAIVDGIIKESDERISEAEASVARVEAAEEPFLKGIEEIPVEEASRYIAELEETTKTAHTAVGGAKTFLAMKRLAAKRLSEASAKIASDRLTQLQASLDTAAKKLSEVKRGMAERKAATLKREAESKVVAVEQLVAEAVEATQALVSDAADLAPEAMKAACEKAGKAQQQASSGVAETKHFLQGRQRDVKGDAGTAEALSPLLERIQTQQVELDKQKAALRDQEHRFVAGRLLKEATEQVEKIEAMYKAAADLASPLTSEEGGLAACTYLAQAVAALRSHAKAKGKTTKALFEEIAEGSLTEAKFVGFLEKLPDLVEQQDMALSSDQLKACFKRMDIKGGGELSEDDFAEHFRMKYLVSGVVSMTDTLAVKGSKTVRKLEVNEIVEQLEEPTKEPALGLQRIKARAEKDGKEGYLTMAGNQGTVYLVAYDPVTSMETQVEQVLMELLDVSSKAQKYVEQKTEELRSVHKGPLSETKAALAGFGPRIRKVQQDRKRLRTTIAESKKKQQEAMEAEKRKRQEAVDRKAADAILAEASGAVDAVEARCEKAVAAAQALAASKGSDLEDPMAAMAAAEADLESVCADGEAAATKIKELMEKVKNAVKGPFSEARAALVKYKVKVGASETKCRKHIVSLSSAKQQVSGEAVKVLRAALAKHAKAKELTADALFKELSGDGGAVTAASVRQFIEAIPDHGVKAAQLDLGIAKFAAGLTRLTLLDLRQEYQRCVKDVAMTTTYEVKDSKTLRKLLVGELVEVLEHKETEGTGSTNLARVRCRALQDSKEGWATLKGNQGTAFLERAPKPYMCCEEATQLQAEFSSSSASSREVQPGEVLEIVEGPRREDTLEALRVRGTAPKDGKSGWVTQRDLQGRECLERSKLLICKQSVAITTTFDIKEGKALRKLDVGEALEIVETAKEDPTRNLTRVKARATLDGKEGWVTLKGNQGTAYAEESDKHYVCKIAVPLEKRFTSGGEVLRTLEEGEVFEVVEGPKTEAKEGLKRVRARDIADGSEGWFTLTQKNFKHWTPKYRCAQSTVINDAVAVKEAKSVRKLEVGETVEALETPVFDKTAGLLRVRVRAEKDGATGYATVRGNQGTVMLRPVTSDRGSKSSSD